MGESSSSAQLVQVFTVLTTRVKTLNLAKLFVRIKSFLHNQSRAEVFFQETRQVVISFHGKKIATFLI